MLTNEQIEALDNKQLNKLGKSRGLKIKTMSPFQIREWLKANPETETNSTEETTMATKKTVKAKTAPKVKKERGVREGTKSAKALEIFNQHKRSPRKDVIEMFIKRLDMSKAGASTYYQNCKKKSK